MSFHPNDVRRRGIAANVIVSGALVFLGAGFFRTQVLEHAEYKLQSETNRLREVPLPAPRGVIVDAHPRTRQLTGGDPVPEGLGSAGLTMVVRACAAGNEPEPVSEWGQRPEGVGR